MLAFILGDISYIEILKFGLTPKEKFRKVYSQHLSLQCIPSSLCPSYFFRFNFPNTFLTPLLGICWASFWLENFLQNAERESIVETSRWVVEREQDFLREFFGPNTRFFLSSSLTY